jgi:hypothetical protein
MSIVYGGKLVSPMYRVNAVQSQKESGKGSQQRAALKALSKQEKLLLDELEKTRNSIVTELKKIDPVSAGDNWSGVEGALTTYHPKSSKGARTMGGTLRGRSTGGTDLWASSSSGGRKTGMDNLPTITGTIRDRQFEKGLQVQGVLKLPVFALPSISQEAIDRVFNIEAVGPTLTENKMDDFHDEVSFAIGKDGLLTVSCTEVELFYISQWLEETVDVLHTFKEAEAPARRNMQPQVEVSAIIQAAEQMNAPPEPQDPTTATGFFGSSGSVSSTSHGSLSTVTGMGTGGSGSRTSRSRTKKKGTASSVVRKLASQSWSGGVSGGPRGISEGEALQAELLGALANMKHHTSRVKEEILSMGGYLDQHGCDNSKARSTVVGMAAERLALAMHRLLKNEMKKGMFAWKLVLKHEKLVERKTRFEKFMWHREVASFIRDVAIRWVGRRFVRWRDLVEEERAIARAKITTDAAVKAQAVWRGSLARIHFVHMRERGRYESMYNACVMIQGLMRGKRIRWKHLAYKRAVLENWGVRIAQRVFRGHMGRKRASVLATKKLEKLASIMIQSLIRMKLAHAVVRRIKKELYNIVCATQVCKVVRGFLARRQIKFILAEKHKAWCVVIIQKVWRGGVTRMTMERRMRQMDEERAMTQFYALQIQKVFRGFRGRVYFKIMAVDFFRKKRIKDNATTKITVMVRGFLARCLLGRMRKERMDGWIAVARRWQETWSPESQMNFYLDDETGEAIWEPNKGGYTKTDGMLVLGNGETIQDPATSGMEQSDKVSKSRICSECSDRVAIRSCGECGDRFCTPCYKSTHQTGTRKEHKWTAVGPKDCSECEEELAERWCVSCDEAYCDVCWRRVHAKGKRLYHPFCELDADGVSATSMFTIDGEEVEAYDAGYPQRRWEKENPQDVAQGTDYTQYADYGDQGYDQGYADQGYAEGYDTGYAEAGYGESEWQEAQDDQGYTYYYNSVTGVSQYESPWDAVAY